MGRTERVCGKRGCSRGRMTPTGWAGEGAQPGTPHQPASGFACRHKVECPNSPSLEPSMVLVVVSSLGVSAPKRCSTYGGSLSGCAWWDGAAVPARWLGGEHDVAWSQRDGCRFLTVAVVYCFLGESHRAARGEPSGCSCLRRALRSAEEEIARLFSSVRLHTNLRTCYRKQLINLSVKRPETATVLICSGLLPVLNMVCARVYLIGKKNPHSWVKSPKDGGIFFHIV